MRVIFNNSVMCVVDYPTLGGVEVLDHRSGAGAFMREDLARTFYQDFQEFLSKEHEDVDDFQDFLDRYSGLFSRANSLH